MINEMLLLSKLDKDIEWFKENQIELENKFNNQFIAIENENIVGHDKDLDNLIATLKKINKDPANTLIKFVSTTIIIL